MRNSVLNKPRFSNQPTKQASPVETETERSLLSMKRKIMAIYKNYHVSEPNTSPEARAEMKVLKENDSIVVKPSDKCKGLVIMNKEDYMNKAKVITDSYEKVDRNPTAKTEALTKRVISETVKGKLDPDISDALRPHHSRCAELYGLPKTHKEDVPLRPIVSAIDDPIDRLSWLLEQITSQLLKYVPAHLKSTDDFLNKLRNRYPTGFAAGTIIFSVDVTNLYGNVPTAEAIDATMELIVQHQPDLDLFDLTPDDIRTLLTHCLNNNYVRFGGSYYKQTQGIAMGSRIAPSLAIVFMGALEKQFFSDTERGQPDMYARYIDDVFAVWTQGRDSLTHYLDFLNSKHESIKFTMERSDINGTLPFLDVLIQVEDSGTYSTELYVKPMAAQIILHFNSAHAMSTKTAVLTSQVKRAIRIGSDMITRKRGLDKVTALFRKNGYPKKLVEKHIRKERGKRSTGELSQKTREERQQLNKKTVYVRLPFISDNMSSKIKSVTRASGLPVKVAWTNQNTIKKQLVRSAIQSTPCPSGRQHCHACHAGLQNKCHIKNVVYQLECSLCGDKYVGETSRPVRLRYNEHLRDGINKKVGTPLGEHFIAKHNNQAPTDTTLTACIVRKCEDEADRRIAESIIIRDTLPALNDNTTSWQLLPK